MATVKGSRGYSPGFQSTTETRQKAMTKRKIRQNRLGWGKTFGRRFCLLAYFEKQFSKMHTHTPTHIWCKLGVQSSTHDCENEMAKVGKKVVTKKKLGNSTFYLTFLLLFLFTFSFCG